MMRVAAILALLAASTGFGQTLLVSTNAGVVSGAVTTSAIDTTGANFIGFYTLSTFGPGTVSDSKSNTWTDIGLTIITHNQQMHIFVCGQPPASGCIVGTSHTFSIANNGSGFNQGMVVFALSGVNQVSADWRDRDQNAGNRAQHAGPDSAPPPFTYTVNTAWKPTGATVWMLASCMTEQGTGGNSTIDSSMTTLDHTAGLTLFYLSVSNPGVNFKPTCTAPGDALHFNMGLVALNGPGTGAPGFPKHKVSAWR